MKRCVRISALVLLCTVALTNCIQKSEQASSVKYHEVGTVIHINSEEEFNKAIAQGNVIVDFYASWCGPCQRMSPIIDALAKEMTDYTFVKVDTEKFSGLTKKFGVRGLPTLAFFKDGQKISQKTGARSKAELRNEITRSF